MDNKVAISVVIPVYNGQDYVMDCLNSLLSQTFGSFEILVVNDGSTDATLLVIEQAQQRTDKIFCFTIENHGQGYARNYALPHCKGEYICFVDADDTLEPQTLEQAYRRARADNADLVVFGWDYVTPRAGKVWQKTAPPYFSKDMLTGDACLELLQTSPFFTVNSLYAARFLREYTIRYGEGYIYEDNPFWVNVCVHAQRVSLIASTLYHVRVNDVSSTKTHYDTDWHSRSFITAVRASFAILGREEKPAYAYLYRYFFERFCLYYGSRTPARYRQVFLREFINVMAQRNLSPVPDSRFYNTCLKRSVFQKKRYGLFQWMLFLRLQSQAILKTLKS